MLGVFRQRFSLRRVGPGGRIIAAVVVMGVLLISAALPLVEGLDKNARLASTVSEELVPHSIRVMALVNNVLEAQSALERFLVTGDPAERVRFADSVEMVHITVGALGDLEPFPGFESDEALATLIQGISDLVNKLEAQAEEVFALHDRPDNVTSAYLINTRGEKLVERSYAFVDMIMEAAFMNESDEAHLLLSGLMGYQDSLSRMMSSVRGYLFLREEQFRERYTKALRRNETIYAAIEQQMVSASPAAKSFFASFSATRKQLLKVFERCFTERDAVGWRMDFDYYRTKITPTLESLKWVLYTLSDTTSQGISQVSSETMAYGLTIRQRTLIAAFALLVIGGLLSLWIYHWVGVFSRQIGEASGALGTLSAKLRKETEQQAREAACQVEEIEGVYRALNELKETLSRIRSQTEEMAQQTDAASLECVQGMEVLSYSQERMASILKQAQEISQAMEETQDETEQMDGILAILNELVDQTKLLSFNATIEAAGAGASGARFAVVAKQVRSLATRAREATQEIREMIKRVQETAEETRRATERGTTAVNEGENLMHVVTERLDLIVGAVSQVSDMAGSIFLATQAQSGSVTQVDQFVGEAKSTAEQVSNRSEQALRTAADLERTARNLARLVGK